MDILRATSKKAWRLFRLPMHCGKNLGRGRGGGGMGQMQQSWGAPTIPCLGRGTSNRDWGCRENSRILQPAEGKVTG